MNIFLKMLALVLIATSLVGCASLQSKTQKLELGMTKQQTTDLLGDDYMAVGARAHTDGKTLEAIKYHDEKTGDLYLYFSDGKLVQWGDTEVLKAMPQSH